MSNPYFQSELAYLREVGPAYAAEHPGIARFLTQQGGDPDVDRLLEGFAFLTGRIRQRVDECVPDLAHDLCDLLAPELVTPTPAAAMVELCVDHDNARSGRPLAANMELGAVAEDGTPLQFRTTAQRAIVPLQLRRTTLESTRSDLSTLRIHCRAPGKGLAAALQESPLRFYIDAAYATASDLLLAVLRHGCEVRVEQGGRRHVLAEPALRYPCLGSSEALVPAPDLSRQGPRLLREYFSFPEKFLFFDVVGLELAAELLHGDFDLVILLTQPPPLPMPLPAHALRLHCVPMVNLFDASAIPLTHRALQSERLLRVDGHAPLDAQVAQVLRVMGTGVGKRVQRRYASFKGYQHLVEGKNPGFYRLRRQTSPIDGAIDTYLSLLLPADVPPDMVSEAISVDLLCTNRLKATGLMSDTLYLEGAENFAAATCLTPLSPPLQPPLGQAVYWQLLSHLAHGHQDLQQVAQLRNHLSLYNFSAQSGAAAGLTNARRLAGLTHLHRRQQQVIYRGAPLFGRSTHLEVDERQFCGPGDVFVLGCILDVLLAEQAPLHVVDQLEISFRTTRRQLAWPPRCGPLVL